MNWYIKISRYNESLPDGFNPIHGSCMMAAGILTKKLLKQNISDFKIIEGYITFDGVDWKEEHTWIEFDDGRKLDPTNIQWGVDTQRMHYLNINRKEYTPHEYLELCEIYPEENIDKYFDKESNCDCGCKIANYQDTTLSGNCGMYAIALGKIAQEDGKKVGIVLLHNAENTEELMNEPTIYHVGVEIDDKLYDGRGEITLQKFVRFAYYIYGDTEPHVDYFALNEEIIQLIRQKTQWTIPWQEYYRHIKDNDNLDLQYLGNCISTVDDSCIWDATEMAQLIENSEPFDTYRLLLNNIDQDIKDKIVDHYIDTGINGDIIWLYNEDEDIHYFWRIV